MVESSPPPSAGEPTAVVINLVEEHPLENRDSETGASGAPSSPTPPPSSGEPTAVVITVVEEHPLENRESETGASGAPASNECIVVDLGCSGHDWEESDGEKLCRVCHLSSDQHGGGSEGSELIELGCGCKGQLGMAHQRCAEAWFKLRGNRNCEICGENAENITGEEYRNFMEEWHGRGALGVRGNIRSSEQDNCWRGQPFCNFLMAALIIAFTLSWFLHIKVL